MEPTLYWGMTGDQWEEAADRQKNIEGYLEGL